MRRSNPGLVVVLLLAGSSILLAGAGIAGLKFATQSENNDTTVIRQEPKSSDTPNKTDTVSIRLVDRTTGEALGDQAFEFTSNDGTQCETAPCPANDKYQSVTSDSEGYISVDRSIIQQENFVQNDVYTSESLKYSTEKSEFTLQMIRL